MALAILIQTAHLRVVDRAPPQADICDVTIEITPSPRTKVEP